MTYRATISQCKLFRYSLTRVLASVGNHVLIIMVNPSTADGIATDHTIRKLDGFGKRLGWKSYTVVNKCAFRATDVKELGKAVDAIGPLNDMYITHEMIAADYVIVAWGSLVKLPQHLKNRRLTIIDIAAKLDKDLYCWGICSDGQPFHPVMISYDLPLQLWEQI